MAYEQHNIAAPGEVIPAITAFATARGWTVSGAKVTRPGGGKTFALSYTSGVFRVEEDGVAANYTRFSDPSLRGTDVNGGSVAERPAVSGLHLFGDTAPAPFLVAVLEYGFNLYRHLYIGSMEIVGGYTGGEVISSTMQRASRASLDFPLNVRRPENTNWLFGGRRQTNSGTSGQLADDAGGVNVVHASNPTPWRRFRAEIPGNGYAFTGTEALGGLGSGFSDALVQRGRANYAGASILTPINLFAIQGANPNHHFIPIGSPAGVRMVLMDGIDPGGEITLGNQTWKCFPQLSKQTEYLVPEQNGQNRGWAQYESSEFWGLAYPKG